MTGMSAASLTGAGALDCAVADGELVTDVTAPSLTSIVTRMAPL